jgi:hypothetical protein
MPRTAGLFSAYSMFARLRKWTGMHFVPGIFDKLLEPINRRQFQTIAGSSICCALASWKPHDVDLHQD